MKKVINILEYILAVFLILDCRSVYNHSYYKYYYIREIFIGLLIALVMIKLLVGNYDKKKFLKGIKHIFIYAIFIAIFMVFNNIKSTKDFTLKFCLGFPLLFLYYFIDKDTNSLIIEFLRKIVNIMVTLAVISLVLYFIGPLTNIIEPTGEFYTTWTGYGEFKTLPSYFKMEFITQRINLFGNVIARNTGIFTEAPMYSLNLTIALAIQMYLLKDKSRFKKIVLAITIITTTSSTGIIILTAMIAESIMFKKNKSKVNKAIKYISIPFLIAIAVIIITNAFTTRADMISGDIRRDDYISCFKAWKEDKIFGNGYGNLDVIGKYISGFREIGQSSAVMVVLAQGGIYLLIWYLIPVYKQIKHSISIKDIKILTFVLVLLLLFIVAQIAYNYMILNMLAIGYALDNKKRNEINGAN